MIWKCAIYIYLRHLFAWLSRIRQYHGWFQTYTVLKTISNPFQWYIQIWDSPCEWKVMGPGRWPGNATLNFCTNSWVSFITHVFTTRSTRIIYQPIRAMHMNFHIIYGKPSAIEYPLVYSTPTNCNIAPPSQIHGTNPRREMCTIYKCHKSISHNKNFPTMSHPIYRKRFWPAVVCHVLKRLPATVMHVTR